MQVTLHAVELGAVLGLERSDVAAVRVLDVGELLLLDFRDVAREVASHALLVGLAREEGHERDDVEGQDEANLAVGDEVELCG
jgi:hypothetical protein